MVTFHPLKSSIKRETKSNSEYDNPGPRMIKVTRKYTQFTRNTTNETTATMIVMLSTWSLKVMW